jgi:2-C-methyl-D-erythritol 4-phosphate cytidylyltransferase
VAPFLIESRVKQIVIVAPAGREEEFLAAALPDGATGSANARAVAGGPRRQDSVAMGLVALLPEVTWVAVHDAARPLIRLETLSRLVDRAKSVGAAVPAVPIADTVIAADPAANRMKESLDRAALRAVQTPQVFRRDWLEEAHRAASSGGIGAADDASLVFSLGHPVAIEPGAPDNIKLTTETDFLIAEEILKCRRGRGRGS